MSTHCSSEEDGAEWASASSGDLDDSQCSSSQTSAAKSDVADSTPHTPRKLLADDALRASIITGAATSVSEDSSAADAAEALQIRNLDTGQAYAIARPAQLKIEDQKEAHSAEAAEIVTDLGTGQRYTLNQFEITVGASPRIHSVDSSTTPSVDAGSTPPPPPPPKTSRTKVAALGKQLLRKMKPSDVVTKDLVSRDRSEASAPTSKLSELKRFVQAAAGAPAAMRGPHDGASAPPPASTAGREDSASMSVRTHRRVVREFSDVRRVQALPAHAGIIFCMLFSHDGSCLATAGQDQVVRLWSVLRDRPPVLDRSAPDGPPAPLLQPTPLWEWAGHTADVVDLSWSSSAFLLSASLDKTVRLWHKQMQGCLRVFQHSDFVASVCHHPLQDDYFLSASIDGKIRTWSIPESNVVDWADLHEIVTACSFSEDGSRVYVGTFTGKCRHYQCEQNLRLEYIGQVAVKNTRAKAGRKITGVVPVAGRPNQLLVTSNDSRIRLFEGLTQSCKYKGHINQAMHIRASLSPDGHYLVSASDDGGVYIWTLQHAYVPTINPSYTGHRKDKNSSYEAFQACSEGGVSSAVFAPDTTRRPERASAEGGGAPGASPRQDAGGEAVTSVGLPQGGGRAERGPGLAPLRRGAAAEERSTRALGQIILAASAEGQISVFENFGMPELL